MNLICEKEWRLIEAYRKDGHDIVGRSINKCWCGGSVRVVAIRDELIHLECFHCNNKEVIPCHGYGLLFGEREKYGTFPATRRALWKTAFERYFSDCNFPNNLSIAGYDPLKGLLETAAFLDVHEQHLHKFTRIIRFMLRRICDHPRSFVFVHPQFIQELDTRKPNKSVGRLRGLFPVQWFVFEPGTLLSPDLLHCEFLAVAIAPPTFENWHGIDLEIPVATLMWMTSDGMTVFTGEMAFNNELDSFVTSNSFDHHVTQLAIKLLMFGFSGENYQAGPNRIGSW